MSSDKIFYTLQQIETNFQFMNNGTILISHLHVSKTCYRTSVFSYLYNFEFINNRQPSILITFFKLSIKNLRTKSYIPIKIELKFINDLLLPPSLAYVNDT